MRMRSTMYHDVKNEFSTLLRIFLLVDVGTFAMNRRTTLLDLAPKTMKSGSPGHEPDAIHLRYFTKGLRYWVWVWTWALLWGN
jgi:hypothetical protein